MLEFMTKVICLALLIILVLLFIGLIGQEWRKLK